jgi:hypothetical protein
MSESRSSRRSGSRRSRSPAATAAVSRRKLSPAALIAAALASLILLWLVVRVSIGNALLESRPDLAAGFAPWHPGALLDPLGDALAAGETLEPAAEAAGLDAIDRTPLSEEPLLLAAMKASAAGDRARADRLIEMANRRNPRSRYGLLLLLEQQLRQNRLDDAALTMAVLSRVMPNSGNLLLAELARMAQYRETNEAIIGVIQAHPDLRNRLLEQLARQGADPDLILKLAGPAARPGASGDARWPRMLLDMLVKRGEVGRARGIWTRLTGIEAPEGVYDPDFRGLPGMPPFNWNFDATSEGVAEITNGGLYAEYYARGDEQLGEQLIMLAPGRYRIGFQADGDASGGDGQLLWTISCHPRGGEIARLPITGVTAAPKTIETEFTVPANCPSQWLRLIGDAAEFPSNQQVTIRQLRISEAGGA